MGFKEKAGAVGAGLLAILVLVVSAALMLGGFYLVVAALWWLVCLGFGWAFSWGAALGVSALLALASLAVAVVTGGR